MINNVINLFIGYNCKVGKIYFEAVGFVLPDFIV